MTFNTNRLPLPLPDDIIVTPALRRSGALRRAHEAQPGLADWLANASRQRVTRAVLEDGFTDLCAQASADPAAGPLEPALLHRLLRQLRQRCFLCLMLRDIGGQAGVLEVVRAMSALAELAIAQAYRSVARALAAVHGKPTDPATGRPMELLIIGMGKLGGRELNVSSDIDLVMLYASDGRTDGAQPISHAEFFQRLTRRLVGLLSDIDEHGFVFRCDLRLRPDGTAGPLAWHLDAFEKYLVRQGREWERYAWIKARVIACKAFDGSDAEADAARVEALRRPFVSRKYLDYDSLAALRSLRERIRQDWERRARGRAGVDAQHNIKLGQGGIREIEFVVQLNQLIRAGRQPSLQRRSLHAAILRQRKAGVLAADLAEGLIEAYFFLRRLEHMLQYREDEQTHLLPRDAVQRAALAQAMGLEANVFERQLRDHRQFVADRFQDAFRIAGMGAETPPLPPARPDGRIPAPTPTAQDFGAESAAVQQQLEHLCNSHRVRRLPPASRQRLERLLPALMAAARQQGNAATTAQRLLDLIAHIAPRSAYLALLEAYPDTLSRVARLVSASPWAAQYLRQHPLLLDSLIEWNSLLQPPDFPRLAETLRAELDACVLPQGGPDVEQQMNLMRDLQHQISFQLLAQDLEGLLSVETLADHLSALADLLLEETIVRVWPLVQDRAAANACAATLAPPRFAVIAYGKLGGKELGYASDLDLVFLYDDPDAHASERYARLGRRMSSWLSTLTSSGRLYEVDLRLRPDGDAGLLAVSMDAFEQYQTRHAWPWEHQAITRARFVAGNQELGARFEAVREHVLLMPRDPAQLRADVRGMRARITAAHPNRSNCFDIKHDRGGMVDVEFIIQWLVLAHARDTPVLLGNLGNIALLRLCAEAGLIPEALADQVAHAYRTFRRHQHRLRLQGADRARLPDDALQDERRAVLTLWQHVLED